MNHQIRPSSPTSIGNYTILNNQVLGRGSNSIVYKGINIITKQQVSIKKTNLLNNIQQKLVINELECLKKLKHPNVLAYHQHFYVQTYAFIVTEICQENLYVKICKNRKIQQKQALSIFFDILNGYQHIRKQGLLHRDLKPENILLKDYHAKIGDFGYGVRLRDQQLKDKFNVGSPLYMAPQVLQSNRYSQKSDIWSLGLILYEMLHGKSPFVSKSERELAQQLKHPKLIFSCHPFLINILNKTLAYKTQQRLSLNELKALIIEHISSILKEQKNINKTILSLPIIQNEINFIKLMEYIKMLSQKCKRSSKKQRIDFIFQINIRARTNLLSRILSQQAIELNIYRDQLTILSSKHSFILLRPHGLIQSDRLRLFDPDNVQYSEENLWQTQAELKDILRELFKKIHRIDSQEKVAKYEDELRLTDFILTFFILNGMLIEGDENFEYFSKNSHLSEILNTPQRFNLNVCKQIQQKILKLQIL